MIQTIRWLSLWQKWQKYKLSIKSSRVWWFCNFSKVHNINSGRAGRKEGGREGGATTPLNPISVSLSLRHGWERTSFPTNLFSSSEIQNNLRSLDFQHSHLAKAEKYVSIPDVSTVSTVMPQRRIQIFLCFFGCKIHLILYQLHRIQDFAIVFPVKYDMN